MAKLEEHHFLFCYETDSQPDRMETATTETRNDASPTLTNILQVCSRVREREPLYEHQFSPLLNLAEESPHSPPRTIHLLSLFSFPLYRHRSAKRSNKPKSAG